MMKLYICSTYYHVYITLLKQLNFGEQSDLVICDDLPTADRLVDKIRRTGIFNQVWTVRQSKLPCERGKNKLDWLLFQHKRRFKKIKPLLPFNVNEYDDIYIFHDGTPLGEFLADAGKRYHLIEDSLNFYKRINETAQSKLLKPMDIKYHIRWLFNMGYFPLGGSPWLIDIEVNDDESLQINNKHIIVVSRQELSDSLSDNDKSLLVKIFDAECLADVSYDVALLLTEPLFADGLCGSLNEQKQLYMRLIYELSSKGYKIILKPHPRDCADYNDLSVAMLPRYLPIELIKCFSDKPFSCVAAVSSSSIFGLNADKRLFWQDGKFCDPDKE